MVIGIVVVVVVVVVCVSGGNANQNRLLSMATNTDKQTQSKWCLGIRKKASSRNKEQEIGRSLSLSCRGIYFTVMLIIFVGGGIRTNYYCTSVLGGASLELGQQSYVPPLPISQD